MFKSSCVPSPVSYVSFKWPEKISVETLGKLRVLFNTKLRMFTSISATCSMKNSPFICETIGWIDHGLIITKW